MGKYEQIRTRAAFAEGAALGGASTGLYHPIRDAVGREVMTRYTRFVHEHPQLYWDVKPFAELAIVLPRERMQAGDPAAMAVFRTLGQMLCDHRLLFKVQVDQRDRGDAAAKSVADAHAVATPQPAAAQIATSDALSLTGDVVMLRVLTPDAPRAPDLLFDATNVEDLTDRLAGLELSRIAGPVTLRASVFDGPGRRILHLVNYNRDEEAAKGIRGPAGEMPIAEQNVAVRLRLPSTSAPHPSQGEGSGEGEVKAVVLRSPDDGATVHLPHELEGGFVRFVVPRVEVYAVVEIVLAAGRGD